MRIVVNNIAASSGGAMTVLKDFYYCVCENDIENEWIFLLSDKYFNETENVKIIPMTEIKKNPIKKVLFDFFTGKNFIKKLNPDVVFSMQNIITFGLKVPQVLYVHQSLPFQNQKRFSFFKSQERAIAFKQYIVGTMIKASIKRAYRVIVQTEWMKKAISDRCKVSVDKVVNILPNVKHFKRPNEDVSFDRTNFFYPTSDVLYKNNELVFAASEELVKKGVDHTVELTLPENKAKNNVKCIGRIPYENVINRYYTSTLVFPSYIETFGYPLAEARQVGTIILAADTEFSRELLNGYENAYFFDPFNKSELVALMEKVTSGEIVRKPVDSNHCFCDDSWKKIINIVTHKRVLFLTNIPSPYRVKFFNELGKKCDLTVLFEKGSSQERDESWKNYKFENFKGIVLNGKSLGVDKAFSVDVCKYINNFRYDNIIATNLATPTGMLAIEYMKLNRIPYYLEGDGAFAKSGKGIKEKFKKYFIKGAKGYFSTSAEHDKYYITYGAPKNKIYRYPFTSISENDILEELPSDQEILNIRTKLGITEKKVVLAVGQFIYRKGFDVLLNAAEHLPDDVGVYFVGGEPTEEYLKIKEEKKLINVHFVGFKQKDDLKDYYMASDVFVLPTREDIWGLVINEAMAYGLPVVTTDRCIAGLELVKNGENGFIVPVDDWQLLVESINNIICDEKLKKLMSQANLEKISMYTFSTMVESHLNILIL